MRGVHDVIVRNNKVQIKLTVSRNLTILQGKSATGKTTLLELIAAYDELGANSGVVINCDVPCKILAGRNWLRDLSFIENSIVFIDEDNAFMKSHEFAHAARRSSNYYVLVAYASTYRIYGKSEFDGAKPQVVIVEVSNSGYEFFAVLCKNSGIPCISAGGKSNIYDIALNRKERDILVIADGAAFGPEMEFLVSLQRFKRIKLFLPESFEWLVLKSGLFPDKRTQEMLRSPASYIESADFFSWEQFFTHELIEKTRGTFLTYSKSRLNESYLAEHTRGAIEKGLPNLGILPQTEQ